MSEEKHDRRIRVENSSLTGMIWFGGWLFTIAFAKLGFWPAVFALLIWPYYIGIAVR